MIKFHRLSRAVIFKDNKVLLAKANGYSNTFLPGGHIEIWESTEEALKREIKEELGIKISIKRFLGDIEHQWESKGINNLEINHIFEAEMKDEFEKIESKENHLEFFWVKLEDIHKHSLQPFPLLDMLNNIDSISSYWKSTLR
jgi:8-oxo-dGTP pyrophosphatase MutT (NUDIX family)